MSYIRYQFPRAAVAYGGAEYAVHTRGEVRVKVPGVPAPVTLDPQDLPPPEYWTAFNLADAAYHQQKKGGR